MRKSAVSCTQNSPSIFFFTQGGGSPLEASLRIPPASVTQGGGSLPLAPATSRSTNAVSGKSFNANNRHIDEAPIPHCTHRALRLRSGSGRHLERRTVTLSLTQGLYQNKPLPSFAPLCRVFRYPLCGLKRRPQRLLKLVRVNRQFREFSQENSVATAGCGQRPKIE